MDTKQFLHICTLVMEMYKSYNFNQHHAMENPGEKIWDSQMKEHEKTIILVYRTWGLRSILRPLWSRENLKAPVCRQPLDIHVMQSVYIQVLSNFCRPKRSINFDRRPYVLYIKMIVFLCSFIWLSQNFSCGFSIVLILSAN